MALSYLNATVAPVRHDDVAVGVHGDAGRRIKLAVPLTVGTKLKQELSVRVVYLGGEEGLFGPFVVVLVSMEKISKNRTLRTPHPATCP